jgi:hypothetical protein
MAVVIGSVAIGSGDWQCGMAVVIGSGNWQWQLAVAVCGKWQCVASGSVAMGINNGKKMARITVSCVSDSNKQQD